jgi:mRNA-degrading endonuclease RelE of RelBE toxin-antitoxin system
MSEPWIAPPPCAFSRECFGSPATGSGDVNALHGDMAGAFRLRLGDYRVLFTLENNGMRIFGVRHRSQAYR